MGARITRMFRNFNIENRVHREISKEKPRAAPRHASVVPPAAGSFNHAESVNQKDNPLLSLLQSVYVESTDPAAAEVSKEVMVGEEGGRRPLKFSLPGKIQGLVELTDVPQGKLTLAEALRATSSHQHQPQTWTPEKIAQHYSLDLKDTKALLEFFIPFQVHVGAAESEKAKRLKAS